MHTPCNAFAQTLRNTSAASLFLLSLFTVHYSLLPTSSFAAAPDIAWDVETSRLTAKPLELRRGETVTLTPRFLLDSAVLPLTNSESCILYYRSTDMTTGLYYAITGAVHSATGGQARVTWTAANCPTATNLQADFVVSSSNIINLRAYATITLRDSVFAQSTTATNPPTVTAADISSITGTVAGTLINAPDLAWEVETSRLTTQPLTIRRGETITLTPRFLLNNTPISFTNTASAALYYRHSALATGLYHAAAGTLYNATNGQIRINWDFSRCPSSATNLQGEIIVLSPGVTNLRATVSITLQDSVFGTALTHSDPTAWRLIDWSTVSNLNLGSAPFPTSQTAVASYGTISGQPSDSTSLVAYVAAQVSGISAATATQIAQTVVSPYTNHQNRADNPHTVTLDQVGGISAATATQIAEAVVAPFTNHQDRTDNPHAVTATQLGALTAESDPFSLHTQSLYSAWTWSGGTYTNTQTCIDSPLLTNGYASATYDSSGAGGTFSLQTSADSNTWSTATATSGPVYLRVNVTIIGMGTATISNFVANSWQHPALWRARPDLIGQIVLTDTPTEARQIANKTYVDAATSNATPSAWATYPAITNVSLANHPLDFGSAYQILSDSGYSAWSYTPVTMSAGTDDVWRLQFGGQDIMRLEPSYTLLSITNFTLSSNSIFSASVWTGGVVTAPYIQYTTNLMSPAWSAVSLSSNSYPTEITPGSYLLQWTNGFSSPTYFRAACGDPTSNIIRFLWPVFDQQAGGNVLTNNGATINGQPITNGAAIVLDIPSTNGLDSYVASTQREAIITASIPSTNGLDSVTARQQAVAAATGTIAAASISGTVASASEASHSTNADFATSAGSATDATARAFSTNASGYVSSGYYWATNISNYSTQTVIIGNYEVQELTLTNAGCTITVDNAQFPADGMSLIALKFNPSSNTYYWSSQFSTNSATNTIPGTAGLAVQANYTNVILILHCPSWPTKGVRQ